MVSKQRLWGLDLNVGMSGCPIRLFRDPIRTSKHIFVNVYFLILDSVCEILFLLGVLKMKPKLLFL